MISTKIRWVMVGPLCLALLACTNSRPEVSWKQHIRAGIVALILALTRESLIVPCSCFIANTPLDSCEAPHYQVTSSHKSKRGIRTTLGMLRIRLDRRWNTFSWDLLLLVEC